MNHDKTNVSAAKSSGLRYVHDDIAGISRKRHGRSFRYRTASGAELKSAKVLQRITSLAIPPAWTEVWICPFENGHLQATGRDAKGRKQYRYHPKWEAARAKGKFEHIISFAEALPRLRTAVRKRLKESGYSREKVIALVVSVLADTLIRVGNESYVRQNHSYGLTTLRNRHIEFVRGGRARLRFKGKSGQSHDIVLDDTRLVKLIHKCQQLPGQALFQYVDDLGQRVPVRSEDINSWLSEVMGGAFTAKDFRTWAATSLTVRLLAEMPLPTEHSNPISEKEFSELEKTVVAQVASALGNTVSVCRSAYIDPTVFSGWRSGELHAYCAQAFTSRQWEQRTITFLKRAKRKSTR